MKATGQPWRFPDGDVMGVLMSAWASTQIRHRSGHCWAWPPTDPMAKLEGEIVGEMLESGIHSKTLLSLDTM